MRPKLHISKAIVKKLVLGLLCVLLLFSPTVLTFVYTARENAQAAREHFFSVTLYNAEDTVIAQEQGNPDSAEKGTLLHLFYQVVTEKRELAKAPIIKNEDIYVRLDSVLNGTVSELDCYFPLDGSVGYCFDSSDKAYSISIKLVSDFLNSRFAEVFYSNAIPPVLKTIDGDVILPNVLSWHYRSNDGDFLSATLPATTDQSLTYEMTGEIGLRFDVLPDRFAANVYDGDTLLMQATLDELPFLTVDPGKRLRFSVHAEWLEEHATDRGFFGSIDYEFRVLIRNSAVFSLNATSVEAGGALLLSCTNVSDPSKIMLSCDVLELTPTFHRNGNQYCALLLFPKELGEASIPFQVSYGASTQSFEVSLTAERIPPSYVYEAFSDVSDNVLSEALSFGALIDSLPASSESVVYFRGNAPLSLLGGMTVGYHHGSTIYINAEKTDSFTAFGTEFLSTRAGGDSVLALSSGRVVTCGESALFGKYVILDHGCGLRTLYGHLSDDCVQLHDLVRQGDVLGHTGVGGLSTGNGFLLVCAINHTLIPPSCLIDGLS